jgi:hypothetical protein
VTTKICRIVGLPIIGVTLLALCLAGCGGNQGSGVATAGSSAATTTPSGPPPASDTQQRLRQYAACLRQHGVQVPDPDQGKSVQLSQTNQPQVKAAAQACQQYAVGTDNGAKSSAGIAQERTYAACMRQHGVTNFPDPDPDHGLVVPKTVLNAPGYPAANRACAGSLGKNGTP